MICEAADEVYGSLILNVSHDGMGPMHQFHSALGVPCADAGSAYAFSKVHSPNKFAKIDLLDSTAECICVVLGIKI